MGSGLRLEKERKRGPERAVPPEPTYGKVARRPSPPPSHVVRSKYSYSITGLPPTPLPSQAQGTGTGIASQATGSSVPLFRASRGGGGG